MTEQTNHTPTERIYEGVLVDVTDGSVTIDINGRLGQLKIPLRMLISEEPPQVGKIVRFMMSYPEIIS